MDTRFKAHPLIRGGQMQTLMGHFLARPEPVVPDEYIHVQLPDGDQIELAINHPTVPVRANLYLLHGLGGDADSTYKLRIAKKLLPLGFRIIRHNHRGRGLHVKDVKGLYHSGSAADVLACVQDLASRWPDQPLGMIGFSLSGTILLNLLSWYGKEIEQLKVLKAAMSVCAPLDLHASSDSLGRVRNKHIDLFFAKTTIDQLHQRKYLSDEDSKRYRVKPTLRKIDEFITAPFAGFQNAAHYYDECSPKNSLSQIRCDTLILAATDDPIVPVQSVKDVAHPANVRIQIEVSGGHMGFLSKNLTPHGDHRWLDSFVENWAVNKLFKPS